MMILPAALALLLAQTAAPPQTHQHDKHAMDARGHLAMGFDQAKITHRFVDRDSGGEIEITAKDAADAATIAQIQAHVKEIEKAFAEGDFSKPFFIHDEKVPGAEAMAAAKSAIEYRAQTFAGGARLVIVAKNAKAKDAVHAFLRYQRGEHGR